VSLSTSVIKANVSLIGCYSLVSPSGNYTWHTASTYQDTITSYTGCDSVMNITLSLESSCVNTISEEACSNYNSPSGNHTWTSSGIYHDTLTNAVNYDSILKTNLTINNSESTIQQTVCDSFTSPSGNSTWMNSGNYLDTIPNSIGSDAFITINLTINGKTVQSQLTDEACFDY